MEKRFYDLFDEEISPAQVKEGDGDYEVRYSEGGEIIKTEIFLNHKLTEVIYRKNDPAGVGASESHAREYPGIKFSVMSLSPGGATEKLSYDAKGICTGRQLTFDENENIYTEEFYSNENKLTGGTKYLKESGNYKYALEFNQDRQYYNCYDFETGDAKPLSEGLKIFEEYL